MPLLGGEEAARGEARLGRHARRGHPEHPLRSAFLGWWWLDPIAALAIAVLAIREGRESWRGESCGCATC